MSPIELLEQLEKSVEGSTITHCDQNGFLLNVPTLEERIAMRADRLAEKCHHEFRVVCEPSGSGVLASLQIKLFGKWHLETSRIEQSACDDQVDAAIACAFRRLIKVTS